MRRTARTLSPALALALGLTLASCGADDDAPESSAAAPTASAQVSPSASAGPTQDADAEFNEVDVRFVQNMLPHHGQAVRNTEIQIAMGSDPEVKALAQKILDTQRREIETMNGLLEEFGAEPVAPPADQQAVWDKNTSDLRDAPTPEARDVIFLTNMVPHHSAAVPMSQSEIEQGSYEPAIRLAQDIKKTQREEIVQMNMMIRMRTAAIG